jgi:hypothetical protein
VLFVLESRSSRTALTMEVVAMLVGSIC